MDRVSLKSLNKIISDLQNGADKINKGSLPLRDIVSLIESTRLLYEKLVILQYLAEKKISDAEDNSENKEQIDGKNQIDLLDAIGEQETQSEIKNVNKNEKEAQITLENPSVNELHYNSQTSLADHFGQQPIKDLTKEIGINEKFLLIENLFEGNTQVYSSAIDKLNNFSNKKEALIYFKQELAKNLNWNLKNNQVKRFIKLIERRYQ